MTGILTEYQKFRLSCKLLQLSYRVTLNHPRTKSVFHFRYSLVILGYTANQRIKVHGCFTGTCAANVGILSNAHFATYLIHYDI